MGIRSTVFRIPLAALAGGGIGGPPTGTFIGMHRDCRGSGREDFRNIFPEIWILFVHGFFFCQYPNLGGKQIGLRYWNWFS